jgi:hypothetical protein
MSISRRRRCRTSSCSPWPDRRRWPDGCCWRWFRCASAGRRPRGLGIALLISALYAALIGVYWTRGEGGFGSLADVARLFEHRGLLLAGWVHYLAFDLLVGVWIRGEAGRIGLPQAFVVPCLLLTFLFGPVGWLLFMALRLFRLRTSVAAPVPR